MNRTLLLIAIAAVVAVGIAVGISLSGAGPGTAHLGDRARPHQPDPERVGVLLGQHGPVCHLRVLGVPLLQKCPRAGPYGLARVVQV